MVRQNCARRGEDLIAAGLLMLAGHVDLDELDHWVRVGWERTHGASVATPGQRGSRNVVLVTKSPLH
jgi:hypothetical protein